MNAYPSAITEALDAMLAALDAQVTALDKLRAVIAAQAADTPTVSETPLGWVPVGELEPGDRIRHPLFDTVHTVAARPTLVFGGTAWQVQPTEGRPFRLERFETVPLLSAAAPDDETLVREALYEQVTSISPDPCDGGALPVEARR